MSDKLPALKPRELVRALEKHGWELARVRGSHYAKRHSVRPGLTGWAQIKFGYGGSETGSLTKLQYELYYIKHQSLRLDWRILLATVRTVIAGTRR